MALATGVLIVLLAYLLRWIFGSKQRSNDHYMWILLVLLGVSLAMPCEAQPRVIAVGHLDEACTEAWHKTQYVESLLPVPDGHATYVACGDDVYRQAAARYKVDIGISPYGFTNPDLHFTVLNSTQVLRTDTINLRLNGTAETTVHNFGQFLVAHEMGHLATHSPDELNANLWAVVAVLEHIKISYEESKLTAKK